jgi:hypothetical protein
MPGAKGDGLVDGAGEVVNLFGIFVFLATIEAIRDSGTGLWRRGPGRLGGGVKTKEFEYLAVRNGWARRPPASLALRAHSGRLSAQDEQRLAPDCPDEVGGGGGEGCRARRVMGSSMAPVRL